MKNIVKNNKKIISMILVITFIIGSFSFKKEEIVSANISSDGYLNTNDIIDISEPATNGTDLASVHTLYLTKDGYVYAQGDNSWGQLGQGHTNGVSGVVKVKNNETFRNGTVTSIVTGAQFSIVLTEDGKAYGFGRSSSSELGFWSADPVVFPKEISTESLEGSAIKKIVANERVSAILSEDGNVYTAGSNANGASMQDTLDGGTHPHKLISNPWTTFNNSPFVSGTHEVVDIFEGSNTIYFSAIHPTTRGGKLTGLKDGENYQGGGNLYDESNGTFLYAGGDNRNNLTGVNNPVTEASPNVRPRILHHINIDSPIVDVAATNYSTFFLTESGKLYRTRGASGNSELIKIPTLVPNRDRSDEDYKFINGETKIKKMVGGVLEGPDRSPLILTEDGDVFAIAAEWTIVRVRENVEDIFKGQRPFIKYKDGTLERFNTHDFNSKTTVEPNLYVELKESNLITVGSSNNDLRNMLNISIKGVGNGVVNDYTMDFLGVDLSKLGMQELTIKATNKSGNTMTSTLKIMVIPENGIIGDVSKTEVKTLGSSNHHSIALSQEGDIYVVGQDGTYTTSPGGFGIPHPVNQSEKGVQNLDNWTKVPLKAGDIIPPLNPGEQSGILKESILDDDEYIIQLASGQVSSKILTNKGYVYTTGSDEWGGQANGSGGSHNATYKKIKNITTADGRDIQGNVANIIQSGSSGFLITKDGYLYGFGSNNKGQLGLGTTNYATHDLKYAVDTGFQGMVEMVMTYRYQTAVLKTVDNKFYGSGDLTVFNMGSSVTRFTEIDISKWDVVGDIKDIYVNSQICIIKSVDEEGKGYIYTLGRNNRGGLGINNTSISRSDIPVIPTDKGGSWDKLQGTTTMATATIYPSIYGTFVYIPGGKLYAWGQNYFGILGSGSSGDLHKPTLINTSFLNGEEVLFIVSNASTLLMTESGRVFATGYNQQKQLGLGHNNLVYSFQESNIKDFSVVKPEDIEVPLSIYAKYRDNKYIMQGATEEQFINKLLISIGGNKGSIGDVVISTNIDTSKAGTQEVTITATDTARGIDNKNRVATTTIDVEIMSTDGFSSSEVKTDIQTVATAGDTTYVLSTDKNVYDLDGNVIVDSSKITGNIIQIVGGEKPYFLTDAWIAYTIEEDISIIREGVTINTVNTLPAGVQGTISNIYTVGESTYFLTYNEDLYSSTTLIRSGVKSAYPSSDNLVLKTVNGWELVDGKNLYLTSEPLEVYSKGGTLIIKTKDSLTINGTKVSGFGSNEEFMKDSQISVGNNITVVVNGVLYLINGITATSITYNDPIRYANGNYVLTEKTENSGYVHSLSGTVLEDITLNVNGTIQLPNSVEIKMAMKVEPIRIWFNNNDTQEDLEKSFLITITGNQGDVKLSYTGFDPTATNVDTQEITITAITKDSEGNILQKVEEVVIINFEVILSVSIDGEEVESDIIVYSNNDIDEVIIVTATGATLITHNGEPINSGDEVKLTEGKHEIRVGNGTKQFLVTYIIDRTIPEKPTFNVTNAQEGQHSKNTVWITDGYDLNVDYTEYKVGDGDSIRGNKVDLLDDGLYVISARTVDKLEHKSEWATIEIGVGEGVPLLDVSGLEDGSFTRRDVRITAEDKLTSQEDLRLTVARDGTVVEGVKLGDTLVDEGVYVVTVTNLAGLSKTLTFTIDKTLPTIVVKNGENEVIDGDFIREVGSEGITVIATDTNVSIKGYSKNGGRDWTEFTNENVFENDNNYVIKAVDKAGNQVRFAFSIATNKPRITVKFEESIIK